MKRLKFFLVLFAIFTLVISACAAPPAGTTASQAEGESEALECTDDIGCVEIAPDEPIRIGYMLSISGATASLGEDERGGVEIAIDDQGDLVGHEIDLVGEDSLCSTEGGQTAAQKLAADPTVVGLIGTTCSSAATAAMPIVSQAGLVMISPSNTAPPLTSDDTAAGGIWQPGYYRTALNDLLQGRVAAEFAYNELGARTMATVHDGSTYADGLQGVAVERFAELGGEVIFQGAVNVGDTDMRPILTEIAANPPDVLYYPIFQPEGNLITDQARQIAGLEDTELLGSEGLFADDFPENTGEAVVGMHLTGPKLPESEEYTEFLAKWDEKYGGTPPAPYHAHAYDAAGLLFDAIEAVAQVGDDGTVLIGRQALRDALTATEGYEGLTGVLSCTDTGDCAGSETLAAYLITEDELAGNWPPAVIWTP